MLVKDTDYLITLDSESLIKSTQIRSLSYHCGIPSNETFSMENVKEWDGIGITRGMHITCSSRYVQQGSGLFVCRSEGYWKTTLSCSLERKLGCFVNEINDNVLEKKYFLDKNGEHECERHCLNFKYFGLQFGTFCYCGNKIQNSPKRKPDGDCKTPCKGNAAEFCGGNRRINIFISA